MNTVCGKSAGICKGVAGGGNTALCMKEVKPSIGSVKSHSISAQWVAPRYLYQFLTSPPGGRLAQRTTQLPPGHSPGSHWIGGWFSPQDRSGQTPLFLSGVEPRLLYRPDLSQIIMPNEVLRQFKFCSRLTIGQTGRCVGDVMRKSAVCLKHARTPFSSQDLSLWPCLRGKFSEITRFRDEFFGHFTHLSQWSVTLSNVHSCVNYLVISRT